MRRLAASTIEIVSSPMLATQAWRLSLVSVTTWARRAREDGGDGLERLGVDDRNPTGRQVRREQTPAVARQRQVVSGIVPSVDGADHREGGAIDDRDAVRGFVGHVDAAHGLGGDGFRPRRRRRGRAPGSGRSEPENCDNQERSASPIVSHLSSIASDIVRGPAGDPLSGRESSERLSPGPAA